MLLVVGVDPIYATRFQSAHYGGEPCGHIFLGPRQRVRLISEMISPEKIPWDTNPVATVEFESLEQFNLALLAFIEEQQQMYRATADALETRGLLTP